MAQPQQYTFEFLVNAAPDVMRTFYNYYNLRGENRNIVNLVTLLRRDDLLSKFDSHIFNTITGELTSQPMAKLWDYPLDKFELFYKIMGTSQPQNKTK